ncbi:hypothetical protein [Methylovulum sp.]|uniref:hypothetical protein n=1 Tax=Methylovulum sp. TaxID=1916980 RepID=UPI0026081FB4|nr:hypothetical protein [Methylovulum sp.]MDD5123781.1 hypothetical protein [Methylovulum sp.]
MTVAEYKPRFEGIVAKVIDCVFQACFLPDNRYIVNYINLLIAKQATIEINRIGRQPKPFQELAAIDEGLTFSSILEKKDLAEYGYNLSSISILPMG